MKDIHCPQCRSRRFYLRDPDDEYETYEFEVKGQEVCFDQQVNPTAVPDFDDQTETYCTICSWHGQWEELCR